MLGLALLHFGPASAAANIVLTESHTLVVVWIERQDALKYLSGVRKLSHAPEAQSVAVQAAQKRTVVNMSPPQQARRPGMFLADHPCAARGAPSHGAALAPALGCAAKLTRPACRGSLLPFAPVEGSSGGGSTASATCRRAGARARVAAG